MSDKNSCPICASTNYFKSEFGEFCDDCDYSTFPWIDKGMELILKNRLKGFKALSEELKEDLIIRAERSFDIIQSAKKISDDDPISAVNLLLHGIEDIIDGIARVIHERIPKAFNYTHEAKMFAYLSPCHLNPKELCLNIEISGKKTKHKQISEQKFFKKDKEGSWKSPAERYGLMFRDGRYYRSKTWKEFCSKEIRNLTALSSSSLLFLDYLETGYVPSWKLIGNGMIIVSIPLSELTKKRNT